MLYWCFIPRSHCNVGQASLFFTNDGGWWNDVRLWSRSVCRGFKGSKSMQVFEKLKWVRKGLVDWKRHKWRSSKVYIDNLREKLCAAFRGLVFLGNKIKRLEKDLKTELQKEEQYWKLKSRVEWLQEGDKNTKFFHSKTVSRRRINRLHGLEDQGGIWYGEAYDIKRIVKSYFQDLFMSANPVGIDEILECVHAIVSFQDNISLSKPILANEVVVAIKQLNHWKFISKVLGFLRWLIPSSIMGGCFGSSTTPTLS